MLTTLLIIVTVLIAISSVSSRVKRAPAIPIGDDGETDVFYEEECANADDKIVVSESLASSKQRVNSKGDDIESTRDDAAQAGFDLRQAVVGKVLLDAPYV